MFPHLTSQLEAELDTVRRVLFVSEGLRDILLVRNEQPTIPSGEARSKEAVAETLGGLIHQAPRKVDWQVYDHCAALTRIYAAYERFVSELVAEYIGLLPTLYATYSDLPPAVTKHYRVGIGHILVKMGHRGRYRKLEEEVLVAQHASGLSGAQGYSLATDAFFIDRQNLRFDTLGRLFSALGIQHSGQYINKHPAISTFIKQEHPEGSSVESELHNFIEYRNEAAHKRVENVLSREEIGTISRFVGCVGIALADMVAECIVKRRMGLDQYCVLTAISETHYDGHVVIGTPGLGKVLTVGHEVVIFSEKLCRLAVVESIQVNNEARNEVICDGITEVGLRLSEPASAPCELRQLLIPSKLSDQAILDFEEAALSEDTFESDPFEALEEPAGESDDQAGPE
jgi:MAE_28990/MAE_18760-like HEPN